MSDQHDSSKDADPTVITLVLPADASQRATITVRNGSLGHMDTFAYDGFKDVCVALNDGMTAFVQVRADPPTNIQSATPKKTAKRAGKPPYKLLNANGDVRRLDKMFDPFELQEKYHKSNPAFKFKDLDEATEVAHVLIEAGLEKEITIAYSNGKPAKVLPDAASDDEPPADDDQGSQNTDETPSDADSADETKSLDTDAKQAMLAVLADDALVETLYDAIQTQKKHGWKKTLVKQREVKGIIAAHVNGQDDIVEQIYQIALDSVEFETASDPSSSASAEAAAGMEVMTSSESAKQDGTSDQTAFTLATDDPDDDDTPSAANGRDANVVTDDDQEPQPALL